MWTKDWRNKTWNDLKQPWDIVVIGGGITGAGIFREAVRMGLRTLLVEAHDFASGTSSRSSKLVHGGLRYLKNAQIKITLESVHEREHLLKQGRGLINQLGFLYAHLQGDKLPGWVFRSGLIIYDIMARSWSHRHYDDLDMRALCPALTSPALIDGYRYFDAQTDDARLVLRLIREGVLAGGRALNYARVDGLLRSGNGIVRGVALADRAPEAGERSIEIEAGVVINAAGAWVDDLRGHIKRSPRLRLLRGSHIVIPGERLPLARALSFHHPWDGRPVFAVPWQSVVLMGTTDVDHGSEAQADPAISQEEAEYLLSALEYVFPELKITSKDVLSTFSGIRPVVNTGKADPSNESREHVIWREKGLLTVSGGKLTTFRLMARDALRTLRRDFPVLQRFDPKQPVLDPFSSIPDTEEISPPMRLRLEGRLGCEFVDMINISPIHELTPIPETSTLWAELRWAARSEGVVHLDDLMLRRTRLGLILPRGGLDRILKIKPIVQTELVWDDQRWEEEVPRYNKLWENSYQLTVVRNHSQ